MSVKIDGIPVEEYYAKLEAEKAKDPVSKRLKKQSIRLLILLCIQAFFFIFQDSMHAQIPLNGINFWVLMWVICFFLLPYDVYLMISVLKQLFKRRGKIQKIVCKQIKSIASITLLLVAALFIGHHVYSDSHSLKGGNGACNSNYSGACVPNINHDINCRDVGHKVYVIGRDVYHLDADNNGIGCESY